LISSRTKTLSSNAIWLFWIFDDLRTNKPPFSTISSGEYVKPFLHVPILFNGFISHPSGTCKNGLTYSPDDIVEYLMT
jgi:hypothetical protein